MTPPSARPERLTAPYFRAMHETAGALAVAAGFAHQQELAARSWEEKALIDPLTGLGNRLALEIYLATVERPKAVLKIDGNNVGVVNKKLGDLRGDQAIVALATMVSNSVREQDRVFRTGGDEILVVYGESPTLTPPHNGEERRERAAEITPEQLLPRVTARTDRFLGDFLALPENEDLVRYDFGISIGGAVWREGMDTKGMMSEADKSMQEVKLANLRPLTAAELGAAQTALASLAEVGMDPQILAKYDRAGYFNT